MGKILKISDRLAERTGGRFCGEIVVPGSVCEKSGLIEMMQKRIELLKSTDNHGDDNFARLSTGQEIIFLQKITKRLELE